MRLDLENVGYFLPGQKDPTYNPRPDAPCPICDKPCTPEDTATTNIAWHPLRVLTGGTLEPLSLFYRVHQSCAKAYPSRLAIADMFAMRHGNTIARRRLS